MSVRDVVQSHTECLVQELLGVEELKVGSNGSILVRTDNGSYTVRVLTSTDTPHIEVFSVLLTEVDNDPGLLEKLNDLNCGASHVRLFWVDRKVVVSGELLGPTAELAGLSCLCQEVSWLVDNVAREIKEVFGGLLEEERGEDE